MLGAWHDFCVSGEDSIASGELPFLSAALCCFTLLLHFAVPLGTLWGSVCGEAVRITSRK